MFTLFLLGLLCAHVEVLRRVDLGAGWACGTNLPDLSCCVMRVMPPLPRRSHSPSSEDDV